MKKAGLFLLGAVSLIGCTDYYDGGERTVLEGRVISDGQPLPYAKVEVWPSPAAPKSGIISELNPYEYENYTYNYTAPISSVTTDANGTVSLSFPKNTSTTVYFIRVIKNNDRKDFGFISEFNTVNHYINVGTLNL
ncbi:MAG TPA: hypothetical protein VKY82_04535 [Flavobacterium sp.]|nr:hypothetical protein [Flavobacterium sp.]